MDLVLAILGVIWFLLVAQYVIWIIRMTNKYMCPKGHDVVSSYGYSYCSKCRRRYGDGALRRRT